MLARRLQGGVLALALLFPLSALAGPAEDLDEGMRLYDDLEYEAAVPKLQAAKDAPSLPKDQRAKAALTLGTIHLVLGEEAAARQAFTEALTLDRDLELPPSASPKIQQMVEDVRASLPPPELEPPAAPPPPPPSTGPLMRHDAPAPGKGPVELVFRFDPARTVQISSVEVHYRTAGEALWFEKTAVPSGPHTYTVELPGPGEARATEYYAEAIGITGKVVAQAGSPAMPLAYERPAPAEPVAPPEVRKPLHQQWWLWAGVGAVVVGGIAAGIALSAESGCDAPEGRGCLRVGVE